MLSGGATLLRGCAFDLTTAAGGSGGAVRSLDAVACAATTFSRGRAGERGGAVAADGAATVQGCFFTETVAAAGDGGALHTEAGATVADSGFTRTSAPGASGKGGAVSSSAGGCAVSNTTFAFASAGASGGALASLGGALAVSASTFGDCSAGLQGGGVYATGASASVASSAFARVSCTTPACSGGAVFAGGSTPLSLSAASSFSSCSATSDGGAVFAGGAVTVSGACSFSATSSSGGRGGAIFAAGLAAVSGGSTFTACTAAADGGALFLQAASGNAVASCTFSGCSSTGGSGGAVAGPTASPAAANPGGATAAVSLTGCTFSGCSAPAGSGGAAAAPSLQSSGNSFSGNVASRGGALALPRGGWLSESASNFTDNSATAGGCVFALGPSAASQPAAASLSNSRFLRCLALGPGARGGAVSASLASVSVSGCSFVSCGVNVSFGATELTTCLAQASGDPVDLGGALQAWQSAVAVDSSAFSSNWAGSGGAIAVGGAGSTLALTSSAVSNNTAFGAPGLPSAGGDGGGVDVNSAASVSVSATIFAGNLASSGGALSVDSTPSASLSGVTASGNAARLCGGFARADGPLSFSQSSFSLNSAGVAGGVLFTDMPSVTSAPPALPACATCTYTANSAASYGPDFATNVSAVQLLAPSTLRTGTPLPARLTLRDGYGQAANSWPSAVITVACTRCEPRVPLSGEVKLFYERSNQSVAAVPSAAPGTTVVLRYTVTSVRGLESWKGFACPASPAPPLIRLLTLRSFCLPPPQPWLSAPISNTVSVTMLPCNYLEQYSSASGFCDCKSEAARDPFGACACLPGRILGADGAMRRRRDFVARMPR